MRRTADETLAEGDDALADDALAEAGAEACSKLLRALVPEKDGEHLEVDDALQQKRDPFEKIVEIENAGDLSRNFVQHVERLRLAGDPRVEPCILDRDRPYAKRRVRADVGVRA